MIPVEVCINCDSSQPVNDSVSAARVGGAARIELCSAMHVDGLTPRPEQIENARAAFQDEKGLMVMIRPRKGDFQYSKDEIKLMKNQISTAADLGADGAVFGVLQKDAAIAEKALFELVDECQKYAMQTTFHRAFDAVSNQLQALEILINAGVNRILSSGTKWQTSRPAIEGLENLEKLIQAAHNKIEIVIGGGIHSRNIHSILEGVPVKKHRVSVHAYSGVQQNGFVTEFAIRQLVQAVELFNQE